MVKYGKYEGLGKVGAGMMQNASSPYAENRSDKAEYLAFMAYGTGFKTDPRALYPGLTAADYAACLPTMQRFHNQAICIQMNAINALTKGQLGRDFGWAPNIPVSIEMAMQVFASDRVTYGLTPTDIIVYDGVKVRTKNDTSIGIFSISRKFHLVGKVRVPEMGWWLNISGYAPIFIKSAYCNNNVGTGYIASHLVAIAPPAPVVVTPPVIAPVPNVVPCTAKVPNVIGCNKVPNVVPCTVKVPNVVNQTTAASVPNVVNSQNILTEKDAAY